VRSVPCQNGVVVGCVRFFHSEAMEPKCVLTSESVCEREKSLFLVTTEKMLREMNNIRMNVVILLLFACWCVFFSSLSFL